MEKGGVGVAGTVTTEAPPTVPVQVPAGTETVKVAEGTETVEVVKEHVPTPEEEGFQEIGDGFYVRNVRLLPFGSSSQIKGEIKKICRIKTGASQHLQFGFLTSLIHFYLLRIFQSRLLRRVTLRLSMKSSPDIHLWRLPGMKLSQRGDTKR